MRVYQKREKRINKNSINNERNVDKAEENTR